MLHYKLFIPVTVLLQIQDFTGFPVVKDLSVIAILVYLYFAQKAELKAQKEATEKALREVKEEYQKAIDYERNQNEKFIEKILSK
jgi:hypothetical protein